MLNFLEPEIKSEAKVNNDYDPVEIVYEIGEGIEELNTELIRTDILTKAAISLEKSIDLDEQIEANNLANRATVSYGIEALDITATFLGYPVDVESIAAGIEDNDQEKPAEEKKSLLNKITEKMKTVYEKIKKIILELIEKVKEFFQSKAIEKAENELEEAAKEVEKATGNDSAKPKCENGKIEKYARAIYRVEPLFVAEHGIKSAKDIGDLFDFVVDTEAVKTVKEYGKVIDKNLKDYLDDLRSIARSLGNNDNLFQAFREMFSGNKSDAHKLGEKFREACVKFFKDFEIKDFKQHPLKEKLISKYEKEIIKSFAAKKKFDLNELEYKILYNGSSLKSKDDKVNLSVTIAYKYKKDFKNKVEMVSDLDSINKFREVFRTTLDALGVESHDVVIKINKNDVVKNVGLLSAKEYREVRDGLDRLRNNQVNLNNDIRKEVTNMHNAVNKLINDLSVFRSPELERAIEQFVNTLFYAVAAQVRSRVSASIGIITRLINAESVLIKVCTGKDVDKNPFA